MNLKELIFLLDKYPDRKICKFGFNKIISWRGTYSELALVPAENVRVKDMFHIAKEAIGKEFIGYKGGSFLMDEYSIVNIEHYGEYTDGERTIELIKEMDDTVDIEGRTIEWLTKKCVELMLSS